MNTEQRPCQFSAAGLRSRQSDDHRCSARSTVHLRIGQEVPMTLKPDAERRRDDGLPHDRQTVQRIVKTERKADDDGRSPYLDFIELLDQMRWRKWGEEKRIR